jgi:hypothetical protein
MAENFTTGGSRTPEKIELARHAKLRVTVPEIK